MNLSAMLSSRIQNNRPVRVGLIGAGKFGSMILSQARHINGLHIMAVADLDLNKAQDSFQRVGCIKAYEHAPASLLMPYMYTQIGFALLGGWLAFGNIPDNTSLLGIALITVCGVAGGALTVIEKRQSKRRMA